MDPYENRTYRTYGFWGLSIRVPARSGAGRVLVVTDSRQPHPTASDAKSDCTSSPCCPHLTASAPLELHDTPVTQNPARRDFGDSAADIGLYPSILCSDASVAAIGLPSASDPFNRNRHISALMSGFGGFGGKFLKMWGICLDPSLLWLPAWLGSGREMALG